MANYSRWYEKGARAKGAFKLTVLRIGQESDVWQPVRRLVDTAGFQLFDEHLLSLEEVCLPFTAHTESFGNLPALSDPQYSMHVTMTTLIQIIKRRAYIIEESLTGKHLKVLDLANFHDTKIADHVHAFATFIFPVLAVACHHSGIKLSNVSPFWFFNRLHPNVPNFPAAELGQPVVSLIGLHPCILSLEMPNLEKIEIKTTASSSVGVNWREERPEWLALKCLDITVNSNRSGHLNLDSAPRRIFASVVTTDTKMLFQFFFQDVVRPELTDLRLNFVMNAANLAIPKAVEIVGSCPNLKKLTLINWPGTNKALIELFGGLPGLEEVSLEHCKNLGNVAFVGLDTMSPVFFKLPKLKKLSLKGLDHMPKITDLLFTMVIRHLKLTHFLITSNGPVKSMTSHGIRALLEEGSFAETIEKFPFQDFSLEGVSSEELRDLEKRFRSYNML